jgi:predicted transcriptional regulator
MASAIRNLRWDDFVRDLKAVEKWNWVDKRVEKEKSEKGVPIMAPKEFAVHWLQKLHDADDFVKENIHLNRKNSGEYQRGTKTKNQYNPDQFHEQKDMI